MSDKVKMTGSSKQVRSATIESSSAVVSYHDMIKTFRGTGCNIVRVSMTDFSEFSMALHDNEHDFDLEEVFPNRLDTFKRWDYPL